MSWFWAGPSLRRCAALALAPLLAALGCFPPPPYREVPNFDVRFADIQTITLVPPLVAVYAMSSGDVEQEVQAWSDAANENAKVAVREQVEKVGREFVPFAGKRGPRPDFRLGKQSVNQRTRRSEAEESWLLFESAQVAILRHTYDPWQTFPDQMKGFDYSLGREARALLGGTQADAFVLMIATDHIPTQERSTLIGVGAVAALATGSYAGPGATPAELVVALVESASGDILWFNRVEMPLADLRDPESSKGLVEMVFKGVDD